MRRTLLLLALLLLTGCIIKDYRGPGTYPGYVEPTDTNAVMERMLIPPGRWYPPPYPGGPIFRAQ
jgi:hypothetical protein